MVASQDELPDAVGQWLSEQTDQVQTSPDIYDALARLSRHYKPAIVLTDIGLIDWNELEFFDHVGRLSQNSQILVFGQTHQQDKLSAACTRGAQLLDEEQLLESQIASPPDMSTPAGAGLLAGSLADSVVPGKPTAPTTPQEPSDDEPQATSDQPTEPSVKSKQPPGHQPINVPQKTPMRLVSEETEDGDSDDASEPEAVFPWSNYTGRPQRTPPGQRKAPQAQQESDENEPEPQPEAQLRPPIQLTPEELAALTGQETPAPRDKRKERRHAD